MDLKEKQFKDLISKDFEVLSLAERFGLKRKFRSKLKE